MLRGCSPFKVVRELGLERRETAWSLFAVGRWRTEGGCSCKYERTGVDVTGVRAVMPMALPGSCRGRDKC